MGQVTDQPYIMVLYKALAAEVGIAWTPTTCDAQTLRQRLLVAKAAAGIGGLSTRISPNGEVWIFKSEFLPRGLRGRRPKGETPNAAPLYSPLGTDSESIE